MHFPTTRIEKNFCVNSTLFLFVLFVPSHFTENDGHESELTLAIV